MCADVQIKKLYPVSQSIDKTGRITFTVSEGNIVYKLSENGLELSTSLNLHSSYLNYILPIETKEIQGDPCDNKETFTTLISILSDLVGKQRHQDAIAISLWILGTYRFKQFYSYPNLWFYSSEMDTANHVSFLLRQLCFNGIIVSPSTNISSSTKAIRDFSPTLILNLSNRTSNFKQVFVHPNLSDFTFLSADSSASSLYCPKIIVSHDYPRKSEKRYFDIYNLKRPSINDNLLKTYDDFRFRLMKLSLQLNNVFYSGIFRHELFPTTILSQALTEIGILTQQEYDTMISHTNKIRISNTVSTIDDDVNILRGVKECISDPSLLRSDGYIPSLTIVDFLKQTDIIGPSFDVKSLRRLITKYGLLVDKPKRIRTQSSAVSVPIVGASSTLIPKQITTLKIDLDKLEQLLE